MEADNIVRNAPQWRPQVQVNCCFRRFHRLGSGALTTHATPSLRPLKALVLDLDGTLLDTAPGLTQALNRALGDIGRSPLALTDVKPMIGDGVTALIEDRKSTRLNSSHIPLSRMPSSA